MVVVRLVLHRWFVSSFATKPPFPTFPSALNAGFAHLRLLFYILLPGKQARKGGDINNNRRRRRKGPTKGQARHPGASPRVNQLWTIFPAFSSSTPCVFTISVFFPRGVVNPYMYRHTPTACLRDLSCSLRSWLGYVFEGITAVRVQLTVLRDRQKRFFTTEHSILLPSSFPFQETPRSTRACCPRP